MEIYSRSAASMPGNSGGDADDWIGRVEFALAIALQVAIAIVTISAFFRGQYRIAFAGTLIFALTFAPALIERRLKISLPIEVTLLTCLFLYASFFLGEVRDFYERFWWWDLVLHGTSALLIGLVGFISIYAFYLTRRVEVAPVHVAVITFAIAVTVGTLWEIFEFLMDRFFGLNMQKSGLIDTMTDLLINSAGAFVAAIIGYFFVRSRHRDSVSRLLVWLEKRRGGHRHRDVSEDSV